MRDPKERLLDILDAIAAIERHRGRSLRGQTGAAGSHRRAGERTLERIKAERERSSSAKRRKGRSARNKPAEAQAGLL